MQVANQQQILSYFKQTYQTNKSKIYAHYSSHFGKIITHQHLMLIPIHQRMATRSHAVFDTVYVKKNKIINLNSHIDRIYASAKNVCIQVPIQKQTFRDNIFQVMKIVLQNYHKQNQNDSKHETFCIRITISSGFGDFGITSLDKIPVVYITVFQPFISYEKQKNGVNEFVVMMVKDTPPSYLVHTKTVNYVENALMANQSKKKGGYQGIKAVQGTNILLQASVANIAFIFGSTEKQFATPRFQTVIEGTTIKKLLIFIEELKQKQIISKISYRDITIQQAQTANEMMVIGGDKIVPVLNFNDKNISLIKGPITAICQNWYQSMNQVCEQIIY